MIPGKSTKVRSGQVFEKIVNTIGLSMIFLLLPHTLSVRNSMVDLTSLKSVNFLFGTSSNLAHYTSESGV